MKSLGWFPRKRLAAVVFAVLVVATLVLGWLPIPAAIWLIVSVVVVWTPGTMSGRYALDTSAFARAQAIELIRESHLMRSGFGLRHWRLSADGDNDGRIGVRQNPGQTLTGELCATRWRPLALNALASACAAAGFVGLELLLSASLSAVRNSEWVTTNLLTDAEGETSVAAILVADRLSQPRLGLLLGFAAAGGWLTAKTIAAWKRTNTGLTTAAAPTIFAYIKPLGKKDERAPVSAWRVLRSVLGWRALLAGIGVVAPLVGLIRLMALSQEALVGMILVTAASGLLVMGAVGLKGWRTQCRAAWVEFETTKKRWEAAWNASTKTNALLPALSGAVKLGKLPPIEAPPPKRESGFLEAGEDIEPPNDDLKSQEPEPPPDIKGFERFLFHLPTGTDYASYAGLETKLCSALQKSLIYIAPGYSKDGQPSPTVLWVETESEEFDAWVEQRNSYWKDLELVWGGIPITASRGYLDPHIDDLTRAFLLKRALSRVLRDLKIGVLVPAGRARCDSLGNNPTYIRFEIPLYGEVTYEKLIAAQSKIADKLGVRWLRFTRTSPSAAYAHICATHPDHTQFQPRMEKRLVRQVASLDWAFWMKQAGLVSPGSGETPTLVGAALTNTESGDPDDVVKHLKFRLPAGVSAEQLEAALPKLRASSEYPFLTTEETDNPSEIMLLVGRRDPLDAVYLFSDHEEALLVKPKRGAAKTDWGVGIGRDKQVLRYAWDDENPHLLVAGSSGSGKSAELNNMLLQLIHNNDPEDIEIWLMEPKNELQRWASAEAVRVFIDAQTAEGSIYEVASATFQAAEVEMKRRYRLMTEHELKPQKITECRHLAATTDDADYLNFPYFFLVVEECTSYFGKPAVPDDKPAYNQMLKSVEELARLGRAAGVYLIFATQNPVKEAIPTTIKRQCRRIGFAASDRKGSEVIIDRTGLENIKLPGRGMLSGGRSYIDFRSFLLRAPSAKNPDWPDELTTYISQLRHSPEEEILKLPPGVAPRYGNTPTYEVEPPKPPATPQPAPALPQPPAPTDNGNYDLVSAPGVESDGESSYDLPEIGFDDELVEPFDDASAALSP